MKAGIIVTGDKKLDRVLAKLPQKLQVKHIKKATRAVAKDVKKDAEANTPVKTGAMAKSFAVRAVTKNIVRKTGRTNSKGFKVKRTVAKEYGAKVIVDRKKLIKQSAKRGRKISDSNKVYFYPVGVELGTKREPAQSPMRRSLKQNEASARTTFAIELRQLIANPK